MNEEQAQFLAHAFSLALCRRTLRNGNSFDAFARSGDRTVSEDEETDQATMKDSNLSLSRLFKS
jgi:hypothetical protein